jgi:hypothetical protein
VSPAEALRAAGVVTNILKLVTDNVGVAKELHDYVRGEGPRPAVLDTPEVPDLTRNVIAQARAHARATGNTGG